MIRSNGLLVGLSIWASDAAWSRHGSVLVSGTQMALLLVPLETHVELLLSTFLRLLREFFFQGWLVSRTRTGVDMSLRCGCKRLNKLLNCSTNGSSLLN
jgi:hypothetical protein